MSLRSTIVLIAATTAALAGLSGCASEPSPQLRAASVSHPHAAEIWGEKCGSCHVPVEPGSRPRATIEAAMQRHQKRAKLTPSEWSELVDFLSNAPSRTADNRDPAPSAGHTSAAR